MRTILNSFDKKPRADFAKVKEILRGYGTIYPQSPYVPSLTTF